MPFDNLEYLGGGNEAVCKVFLDREVENVGSIIRRRVFILSHRGTAPRRQRRTPMAAPKQDRWSQQVTETSDALSLEPEVFTRGDPAGIARSLKNSAETSTRRKSGPFRSAMSMLTFYINRAGKNLPGQRKRILEQAKNELRRLYGRRPR